MEVRAARRLRRDGRVDCCSCLTPVAASAAAPVWAASASVVTGAAGTLVGGAMLRCHALVRTGTRTRCCCRGRDDVGDTDADAGGDAEGDGERGHEPSRVEEPSDAVSTPSSSITAAAVTATATASGPRPPGARAPALAAVASEAATAGPAPVDGCPSGAAAPTAALRAGPRQMARANASPDTSNTPRLVTPRSRRARSGDAAMDCDGWAASASAGT